MSKVESIDAQQSIVYARYIEVDKVQLEKDIDAIKEICKKHNLDYREESVFKRAKMRIELMVGKTQLFRVEGI